MAIQIELTHIFERLRSGQMPEAEILRLVDNLKPGDTTQIMDYVEGLSGPEEFMDDIDEYNDADNARSEVIVRGFFLFIDLVSALILKLGDDAITEAQRYENSPGHYVQWVIKYCTDERFAKGIKENFEFMKI